MAPGIGFVDFIDKTTGGTFNTLTLDANGHAEFQTGNGIGGHDYSVHFRPQNSNQQQVCDSNTVQDQQPSGPAQTQAVFSITPQPAGQQQTFAVDVTTV